MNVGEIEYTVSVETQKSITAAQQFDKQMDQVQDSARKTDRELSKLDTGFSKLATAIKGVIAASALRSMAGMVQQYQEMSERVRDATDSVAEFEMVQARLQATSNGTYRALSEVQEIYIQSSRALKNMGYSTSEALDVVDSLSYAFVRNATSSDKAQSAMTALVRATNRGTVLTDHWASLLVAVPTILDDISAATGITAAEISALGYAGELTADMLTEGLRKSLDANRAAADGMANSLVDAGVRTKEAVTGVLFALEQQTGGLQTFTNGIIAAADAMIEFGSDGERMAQFLQLAELAAASLAAVMAGRVIMSMAASTKEFYANTIAARAKSAAELQAAQTAAALAAENLIQAQTAARAAVGMGHQAQAAAALTAAENAATAATARLTAAQSAMAGAFSVTATAAGALRTALAFLGGPAGIILLVGAAFLTMGRNAKISADELDNLGDTIGELGQKTLEYRKVQLEEALREQEAAAAKAERKFKDMERQIAEGLTRSESFRRKTKEVGAQMEEARANANRYADALRQVNDELDKRAAGADVGPQRPEDWKPTGGRSSGGSSDEGFRKLEQYYQNQIEIAKRTGMARAELAALQRLGADATEEEKARISELAKELYRLEQAQKKSVSSTKSAIKGRDEAAEAAKSNAKALADLREQLYQTTLDADELVQRQAELTLNEYATPEQREQIRALALELRRANEAASDLERRKQAFGDDVGGSIRGNVQPLSGGMFDDQAARYEAEAQAEQQRYAEAMERLREAKELELEVKGGYMALEQQMAQEHADRMAQIEQAKTQVMMQSAEQGFGAMAGIMKTAFGEQSALYKAAFVAQKAAAIAQSIVAIQQGIAMAAANPWPTNIGAMASVAAATAGIVSNIASTQIGSRRQGGPVSPGSMYRVNEGGRPEVFQNNLGQQYMIPNERGKVISNSDASKGGGGVVVNIHNAPPGTQAESSEGLDGEQVIDIWVADLMADGRTASAMEQKYDIATVGR